MRTLAFLAVMGFLLAGCAAAPATDPETNDPYEATNRQIFDLNLKIDRLMLRPNAERYVTYVPEGTRDAIHNALDNLHAPVVFANDVLQGEPKRASRTAGRFLVNSTIGLAGVFDVGTRLGIEAHEEDFGQTLAVWGAGEGPYLVLPLLGPSNPRDAIGKGVDLAMDPLMYIKVKRHVLWAASLEYATILDERARNLEAFDDIERTSLDFYATARSLYRQHRESEIRNGMPESNPATNLP
jgi:phospholipid-binding lipoprotein MlaA